MIRVDEEKNGIEAKRHAWHSSGCMLPSTSWTQGEPLLDPMIAIKVTRLIA